MKSTVDKVNYLNTLSIYIYIYIIVRSNFDNYIYNCFSYIHQHVEFINAIYIYKCSNFFNLSVVIRINIVEIGPYNDVYIYIYIYTSLNFIFFFIHTSTR